MIQSYSDDERGGGGRTDRETKQDRENERNGGVEHAGTICVYGKENAEEKSRECE